jgi:hypothetical protein
MELLFTWVVSWIEMFFIKGSTDRNLPGGKGWLACKADNPIAIYEPIA